MAHFGEVDEPVDPPQKVILRDVPFEPENTKNSAPCATCLGPIIA